MNNAKISKIVWLIALISGAIAILGEYEWVTVKWLRNYNFEILLIGFVVFLLARLLKK